MELDALPEEIAALRARLRAFVRDELLSRERAEGLLREADVPADLRREVRARSLALGFYRLLQPTELGGGGLGPLGAVALREEIAAANSVLGAFVLGGSGGLLRYGTPVQRERYLLPVLRGELAAAFAFTDAREGPRTTATFRNGFFVLSGRKAFVSGGPHADLLLTVATVVENAGGPTGSAVFIVSRTVPGVVLRRAFRTLDGGLHGDFAFDSVAVPPDDLLGEIGTGLPRALDNITGLRLNVAAQACGAGRWALDHALEQATRPHRSGTPLSEHEQVQAMLADSAIDLFAARAAVYAAAREAESGADATTSAATAKILATEAVARIVDRAMQLAGGQAVVEDHPLAVLYQRVRGWRIAEGANDVLRLTIARTMLAQRQT